MCEHVNLPGGGHAIICTRGAHKARPKRCHYCSRLVSVLCDQPLVGGGTCDRGVCDVHALNVGLGRDLCWEHARDRTTAVQAEQDRLMEGRKP